MRNPLRVWPQSASSFSRTGIGRVWIPAVVLVTTLVGTLAAVLVHSHDESRNALQQRYALRSALAGQFVTSYVVDFQTREAAEATSLLAGRVVSAERFALASRAFGFGASVLLDSQGRALDTLPVKTALLGTRLDVKYAHLRAAVSGHSAVSNVVPSAAEAVPIVALAVPFATPFGRRVFSGGAPISHTPLSAFLSDALPFKGAHAYLIDATGKVIVAGGLHAAALRLPPHTSGAQGFVTVDGTRYVFASFPIARTPWRLLTLAPSAVLFAPISGRKQWASWLALFAFALAAAAALFLLRRLLLDKAELAHLATRDPLTGALNRRALDRSYEILTRDARGAGSAVGVLAVDIDHFKDLNDAHGHAAGDALLRRVAEILWIAVRPVDAVARIGGDEFIVLLADVTRAQAAEIGARAAAALEDATVGVSETITMRARCSVGIAVAAPEDTVDTVLARADCALYEAKAARPPIKIVPMLSRRTSRGALSDRSDARAAGRVWGARDARPTETG